MGVLEHGALVVVERAAVQRFQKQAHGMQRLAQVMAGRCEKAGFVAVGLLGGLLRRQGPLRLGPQLADQALVFQLERNAAPRGTVGRASLQAGQRVVHPREEQRRPHHGPPGQCHRHHHTADGAGEVGDVGAVQRCAQP